MLLQSLSRPFSMNGAVTDLQVSPAVGTNIPPVMALELCTDNYPDGLFFLFYSDDISPMISKNNFSYGLVRPQHTSSLCVSSPARRFLGAVDM